jgi:hypothetical protein
MFTMSPDDCGLFWKGYMEVPVNAPGLNGHGPGPGGPIGPYPPPAEQIVPPAVAPPVEEIPSARRPVQPQPVNRTAAGNAAPPANRMAAGNAAQPAPVAPASSRRTVTSPPPSNSYNPSSRQTQQAPARAIPQTEQPGFIGPRGYDVRN